MTLPAARSDLILELAAETRWIPLVQQMIETGAPLFGLEPVKALRLAMSAEELLAHLASTAPESRVTLSMRREADQVLAAFSMEADIRDLWAMNLTATAEITPDHGMDQMGLLLASRLSDTIAIRLAGRQVTITLGQAIAYPDITPADPVSISLKGKLSAAGTLDPTEINRACSLALAIYPPAERPDFLNSPGRLIDRIDNKAAQAAVLKDATGAIGGLIVWESTSTSSVGFYGPFLFMEDPESLVGRDGARLLVDGMIGSVARTPAMILYSIQATRSLPPGSFEPLATLTCRLPDETTETRNLWFRHLREDTGRTVWSHPSMTDFLKKAYDRLFLLRTVVETAQVPARQRQERSLFAAALKSDRREAVLTPMLDGPDIRANIERHVRQLTREGFLNLFFSIDLASGWQAAMGGALFECGFAPAYVLPFSGESDSMVFQYDLTSA